MEKYRFMRLWFMTFAAMGALGGLFTFDLKLGVVVFAAAMIASAISWIYLNELWFKRQEKPVQKQPS